MDILAGPLNVSYLGRYGHLEVGHDRLNLALIGLRVLSKKAPPLKM